MRICLGRYHYYPTRTYQGDGASTDWSKQSEPLPAEKRTQLARTLTGRIRPDILQKQSGVR